MFILLEARMFLRLRLIVFNSALLLIVSGCSLMLTQRVLMGVKRPKVTSTKQIEHFIEKNEGFEESFALNEASFLTKATQSGKFFSTWELYDENGFLVIPKDTQVRHVTDLPMHSSKVYTKSRILSIQHGQYLAIRSY